MANYKRLFLQNHPIFITVVTFNRNPILIKNVALLNECFEEAQSRFEYEILASVILPDHFHVLINPRNIDDYPRILSSIKWHFSKNIDQLELQNIQKYLTPTAIKRQEKGVWQRRYYEHTIRDDKDLQNHIDYIHYNPVKHKYSNKVMNWEYSSFQKFVEQGNYESNWGSFDDIKNISDYDYE